MRRLASGIRRKVLAVRPPSNPPFASHQPILTALASADHIEHVLELGAGSYSTGLFLSRNAFPDLTRLTSYEDDPEWAQIVLNDHGDERLTLVQPQSIPTSVPSDLSLYDLIFIDDSVIAGDRARTIKAVKDRNPDALVVVHDFEQGIYRRAARGFKNRIIARTFSPQVGILWNSPRWDRRQIGAALKIVEQNRNLAPTDQDSWHKLFSR